MQLLEFEEILPVRPSCIVSEQKSVPLPILPPRVGAKPNAKPDPRKDAAGDSRESGKH